VAAPIAQVFGVKALLRDISKLEKDERSALWSAMKKAGYAAVQPIVPAARGPLPVLSGDLANTIRASGTRSGGSVRMGRPTVPYAGWVEFGGSRPDGSERTYVRGGRYLFPAAVTLSGRAADTYTRALSELFGRSDIWSNTTEDGGRVHD
jgi:hypothetical protein